MTKLTMNDVMTISTTRGLLMGISPYLTKEAKELIDTQEQKLDTIIKKMIEVIYEEKEK